MNSLTNFFKYIFLFTVLLVCIAFAFTYYFEIHKQADDDVNDFVKNLDNFTTPKEKITEIANFSIKDYYQTYNTTSFFPWFYWWGAFYGELPTELHQKPHIRPGLLFSNDPYFIGYYRTGACDELASYFNFIARKAGFESRIVRTTGEDHAWDEIKINNTWIQVDPTIYYHYSNNQNTLAYFNDLWYNNSDAYNILSWAPGGYSRVFVSGTEEDLTDKYCNATNLTIFSPNCNRIKIKPQNTERFSLNKEIQASENMVLLGRKNYSVIGEQTIIPYLVIKEDNVTVSLLDNNTTKVTLVPNEIKPTVEAQLLLYSFLLILIFGIIFFGARSYYEFFYEWWNKRK